MMFAAQPPVQRADARLNRELGINYRRRKQSLRSLQPCESRSYLKDGKLVSDSLYVVPIPCTFTAQHGSVPTGV